MVKYAFVILHYLTDKDTAECVESILKNCDLNSCAIIIVDNNSSNGSLERLQAKYGKIQNLDIIHSDENVGFARGNNLGISFAREKYKPEFVIVSNNDVIILQSNICDIIAEEYDEYKFSVMGPMILSRDGHCNVNPLFGGVCSVSGLKSLIKTKEKLIKLNRIHLLGLYNMFGKIKNAGLIKTSETEAYIHHKVDTRLHGSFLIFSKDYFNIYKGFFPGTFLFLEEDILFYLCQKAGIHTLYSPRVIIYHKEDSATNVAWKDLNKVETKDRYILNSAKAYIKLIQEQGELN